MRVVLNATSYTSDKNGIITITFENTFGETVKWAKLHSLLLPLEGIKSTSVTQTSATFDLSDIDIKQFATKLEVCLENPNTIAEAIVPDTIYYLGSSNTTKLRIPTSFAGINASQALGYSISSDIEGVGGSPISDFNSPTVNGEYIDFNLASPRGLSDGFYDVKFHVLDFNGTANGKSIGSTPKYRVFVNSESFDNYNTFMLDRRVVFIEKGYDYRIPFKATTDYEYCDFYIHYYKTDGKKYKRKFGYVDKGEIYIPASYLAGFVPGDITSYASAELTDPQGRKSTALYGDFIYTFYGIVENAGSVVGTYNTDSNEESIIQEELVEESEGC